MWIPVNHRRVDRTVSVASQMDKLFAHVCHQTLAVRLAVGQSVSLAPNVLLTKHALITNVLILVQTYVAPMHNATFATTVQFVHVWTVSLATHSLVALCPYPLRRKTLNLLTHVIRHRVDQTLNAAIQMAFLRARVFPHSLVIHQTANPSVP